MEKIAEVIYRKRRELGLTQREFAEMLDVSDKTVSRWETGTTMPDSEQIPLIAAALKIRTDDLFDGEAAIKEVSKKKEESLGKNDSLFKILSFASFLILIIATILISFSFAMENDPFGPFMVSGIIVGIVSLAVFVTGDILYCSFYHTRFSQGAFRETDAQFCIIYTSLLVLAFCSSTLVYYFARTHASIVCSILCFAYIAIGFVAWFIFKKAKPFIWKKTHLSVSFLIIAAALDAISLSLAFLSHPIFTNISLILLLVSVPLLAAGGLSTTKEPD
ncbi:MAG: helix-turn-helix domain-containing protein [Bacilli bacterium]|jgi:transcriptional regulator with XRE-family HTH domain|nr:helix-turn-helix domain-containing protein [Bacilli bacterium]